MQSPTSDSSRLMRATAIGVGGALVSALGHALAGLAQPGHQVNWWAMPIVAVAITMLAMIMTESEFTLGRLAGFMVTTQILTHIALSLGTGNGHQHGADHHTAVSLGDAVAIPLESSLDYWPGIVMLLTHIAVGAAITWLLYQGESLLFRMHRQIPGFIRVLTGRGIPRQFATPHWTEYTASFAREQSESWNTTQLHYLAADPWRGPPVRSA